MRGEKTTLNSSLASYKEEEEGYQAVAVVVNVEQLELLALGDRELRAFVARVGERHLYG